MIKDFVPGQDVIDVSDIDADSTTPGQQSFRWVGKATLTGAAQLGYYVSGGNTIVRASTDADAAAEVEIQLNGSEDADRGRFPVLGGQRSCHGMDSSAVRSRAAAQALSTGAAQRDGVARSRRWICGWW